MANADPFVDPIAVSRDTVQNIGVTARDHRFALGALSQPSSGASFGNQSGVFPGGSAGAGAPNDLQCGPGGGMTTRVQAGAYACDRGSSGLYLGALTAATTISKPHPAAPTSNPRWDIIVVRNRDPGVDQSETVTQTARFEILDGAPASSPQLPLSKLTSGDVYVGAVLVRPGVTSLVDNDYGEVRNFVAARGGIMLRVPGDNRSGSFEGQYRDNLETDCLERWSGTTWEPVATPAVWKTFTPRLYAQGSRTDVNIGQNGLLTCRYQLVGKRLDFAYSFRWGATPYNGGYGDVCTYLPKHPFLADTQLIGVGYPQWVQAHLWSNNAAFVGDFFGQALVVAGSSRVQPFFSMVHAHQPPNNPINMNTKPYKIADSAAKAASGVPRIFNPDGFPEGGTLEITGSCEVTW